MQRLVRRWWLVATLALGGLGALGALGGCTAAPEEPAEDVLLRDDLLVPIPRELDGDAAARRQATAARLGGGDRLRSGPPRTFYLAVRRSALEQRWFWSVYLKELQPWGPSPGTLGTKVIRFREQNGKLYVFDADDRRATSDVFNPDLIIDAFPIVDSHHFHSLPGSGGYILIDPAAGPRHPGRPGARRTGPVRGDEARHRVVERRARLPRVHRRARVAARLVRRRPHELPDRGPRPEQGLRVRRLADQPEHQRDPRRERLLRRRLLRAAPRRSRGRPRRARRAAPRPKTKLPKLLWQGRTAEPLCVRWAPAWEPRGAAATGHLALTGAQKLERYIQFIAAHEVGHTLGLRHNFKGSLVPPSSSVMEYSVLDVSIAQPTPGPYDVQAIRYLYGGAPALPTLPFCTDPDTTRDPDCVRFDPGTPDPLNDYHIPDYALYTGLLLDGLFPPSLAELIVNVFGTELLGFARAGTAAQATAAWQAMLAGARAPLDPADLASNPALGPAADALSAAVFREALVTTRAAIRTPFTRPAVIAAIAADGEAILANQDGVRSYPTRRLVVDALKRAQTLDAYLALLDARAAIVAQLPTLPPTDAALTQDLLARLDAAISPYFE